MPEFFRSCIAVCCLEQNFPIAFHTPIVPREVLLCGRCLVASTELIRKLPNYERLVHGYGCVAIENVHDIAELAEALAAIVQDQKPIAAVGKRGRSFACRAQQEMPIAERLDRILDAAASRQRLRVGTKGLGDDAATKAHNYRFSLTQLAAVAITDTALRGGVGPTAGQGSVGDLARARDVLAGIKQRIGTGDLRLKPFVEAIETEVAIATAENEEAPCIPDGCGPLFRLHIARWAMAAEELGGFFPLRDPRLRILEFDYDVSELMGVRLAADLPASLTPRRSYIVAFVSADRERNPLVVDRTTAQILKLSDGTRTALEVIGELKHHAGCSPEPHDLEWLEGLLVLGLISLHDKRPGSASPDDFSYQPARFL